MLVSFKGWKFVPSYKKHTRLNVRYIIAYWRLLWPTFFSALLQNERTHKKEEKKTLQNSNSYLCIAYLVWDGINCDMSSIFYLLYGLLRGKENEVFVKKSLENDFNHLKLSAQLTMKKDEMKLMCNFSKEDLPSLICILGIWLLFCSLHDFTWLLLFHSVNTDTSVLLSVEQQVSLPRKKMEFSSMWYFPFFPISQTVRHSIDAQCVCVRRPVDR